MKAIANRVLIAAMCLLLPIAMWAQGSSTAELHVTVKDPNGDFVKGASVAVRNDARNFERQGTQTGEGEYQFLLLPPGQYNVIVNASGFAKTIVNHVTVTVGQRAELPVTLQLASVSETVNVSGEAELVQTQVTSANTTVDQVRIENLPINGRNYIQFGLTDSKIARDTAPSIGAAPTSGLNFSGQRARSNLVNVDGADAVDNSTNGIRSTVSQEAVQEFQIITQGYNAEYGRASGGVVNIITRSGTNDFHGTAFGYLRNRNIQAKPHFSNTDSPAYTRYQAGIAFGGPIKKDRTFYYFSYEATRRRESGYSTIGSNNFDLVSFNSATVGLPFGNMLVTPAQATFMQALAPIAAGGNAQAATLLQNYAVLAGGGAGLAVNGALPSAAMAIGIGQKYSLACAATFNCPLNLFPTSGLATPGTFHPMSSLIGNFPVGEETSLYSLRIDHRLTNSNNLNVRVGVSPSTATGIQVNAQGPQNFGQNAWSRTSEQQYRDFNVTAQDTQIFGTSKVNEFRFQYARRGLRYNYSSGPGGSDVAVNMAGYGFWGREPFSYLDRTEERYQFLDNFTLTKGNHTFKWGVDYNHLPLEADFALNFGGIFNIGSLQAGQLLTDSNGNPLTSFGPLSIPGFSPVQAYGLGIPGAFIQGVGNPHDQFKQNTLGAFIQDSWRVLPNVTMNYGVRYDVEFTPVFSATSAISQAAQDALGITQGIPRDYNNVAPRIGVAWDPWNDGKTVIRASYGIFYDHPLLALALDSDITDGSQAPQVILFPGAPGGCSLNASNVFQGFGLSSTFAPGSASTACTDPAQIGAIAGLGYVPGTQRFNPAPNAPSLFTDQQYLTAGLPLVLQPFGFPTAKDFVYSYSNQANLTFEHDLGHDMSLSLEYNFNGGRHLNRPINTNTVRTDLLFKNYSRARNVINAILPGLPAQAQATLRSQLAAPESIGICPSMLVGLGVPAANVQTLVQAYGNFQPAALMSFFRPSGINPSLLSPASPVAPCATSVAGLPTSSDLLSEYGLGLGVPVPFSDMPANFSNGTSTYHGFTANFKKRMRTHYEFLMSYTWGHALDDGTDLQSPLSPQDNYNPRAERGNSLFDQRHRFVFSGVYNTGRVGASGFKKILNDWTIAPIIEVSSGRPFNIITYTDRNHDLGTATDRPNIVPAGTTTNACGDPVVPSAFSPTGYFQLPCDFAGQYIGSLGRNTAYKPWTVFNDLRIAKRIAVTERVKLEGIVDIFNIANKYNVADVSPLYTNAGQATAAFDPRQFQFALKLNW